MKALSQEGSWLKHIAAGIGLVENCQVSGPQDERARESLIVAEPDVHAGKTSVGMHDQIQVFQELN